MKGKVESMASITPPLSKNSVHVWKLVISEHLDQIDQCLEVLNLEEKQRVVKFRFKKDRTCAILSRGMLRRLLSNYTNLDSQKLSFSFNEFGKPELEHKEAIYFNVSHAADVIVYAFTLGVNIGIDVEKVKPMPDSQEMANHFFSKVEANYLKNCPSEQRDEVFFSCWTRKEAFIKAVGEGLSYPLNSFQVPMEIHNETNFAKLSMKSEKKHSFSLFSFIPHYGYKAALVTGNEVQNIDLFNVSNRIF